MLAILARFDLGETALGISINDSPHVRSIKTGIPTASLHTFSAPAFLGPAAFLFSQLIVSNSNFRLDDVATLTVAILLLLRLKP